MAGGKPWSSDLAWVIIRMSFMYKPQHIAIKTGVPLRTIQRMIHRFHLEGSPVRARNRMLLGRRRILDVEDISFIRYLLAENADSYLDELQELLWDIRGKQISISALWRSMNRAGITWKKLTKYAQERSKEKRAAYIAHISQEYTAEQLIILDESSIDKRSAGRRGGWSDCGARAIAAHWFVRKTRYSVLPAMTANGIIGLEVIHGSFKHKSFRAFIRALIHSPHTSQYPGPNSVFVFDNASIHKDKKTLELIQKKGMRYEFLPPYSPDFSPIELGFSKFKAGLRRRRKEFNDMYKIIAEDKDDLPLRLLLVECIYAITPDDCYGYFKHCGYF